MKFFDLKRFSLYHCKDRLDPKTGKCYWKCDKRKCKDCIIKSSVDCILKQTAHNMHGPDIPQIEVQQSVVNDVTISDPRWRPPRRHGRPIQEGGPHGVRSKMAAPRSQIQDGGPCDAFGYTWEGESTL